MKQIVFTIYVLGSFLAFGLWACSSGQWEELSAQAGKSDGKGFALVEMFTSEGCSSCPPAYNVADMLLQESQANGTELYILDYHVDYWDATGWIDPFSQKGFTERQRQYKQAFNFPDLFTPQSIVNGKTFFVGSSLQRAKEEVKLAQESLPEIKVNIASAMIDAVDSIAVSYELSGLPERGTLNLALAEEKVVSHVMKGDNAGKTLTHHFVVHRFRSYPIIEQSGVLRLPNIKPEAGAKYKLVLFVQQEGTMAVLGASGAPLQTTLESARPEGK